MPVLDLAVATHRLTIESDRRSVEQAPRRIPDLAVNVKAEFDKLITAKFIWEV